MQLTFLKCITVTPTKFKKKHTHQNIFVTLSQRILATMYKNHKDLILERSNDEDLETYVMADE